MKLTLSTTLPSQIETECLVVPVVDAAPSSNGDEGGKHAPEIQSDDQAVRAAGADLVAAGEITGKLLETALLHKPQGLKAKRVLFIGAGKAADFSSLELRKVAGVAVRALKSKGLKSFAFVAPHSWTGRANPSSQTAFVCERGGMEDAVKAIVEGAYIGNFDPDYYKSDRKDQKIEEVVIVTAGQSKSDDKSLKTALEQGRVIGEAQNFTRDLVNEPGNRMTPTILAERARKMSEETGL